MANVAISNLTATWNASGTIYKGIQLNVTNTASASGSKLFDFQVGGTSYVNADTNGVLSANGYAGNSSIIVTDSTTARTLSAADNGKIIYFTNASAITVTTASGLGQGFSCALIQGGTGQITIAQGAGCTLASFMSAYKSIGQYASLSVMCPVASTFYLAGNVTV